MHRVLGCLLLMSPLMAGGAVAAEPLKSAVDGTNAPHAFASPDGGLQGFNIDLFKEVAVRLGRDIKIENGSFAGLLPAMFASRYDFLATPMTATEERSHNMLFTEGYLHTEFQFVIPKDAVPLKDLADLKGKTVSVNKGSVHDKWAQAAAAKYGFTVQTFDTQPDAIQAVLVGQVDANLAGSAQQGYAATKLPGLVADLRLPDTRTTLAAPFRLDSVELRNEVERAIECMKLDGTLVAISEKWLGATPAEDAAERVVYPGYGVPGLAGYDATPHEASCAPT
jgi:polar amino acid transport system substrate-binding protein